ncbi:DUF397 domain-containing protein [Streptomyces armeniacus]|uniref:DUF397 domain-containing protein n=1 Tax=Streptomyces armeniacus TaxID=83291 RepID=A0A345XMY1_9ACTN|nr:DUF397 domain-containing protein [Streptomyces armeniacus]AXK32997.1 DUF397 domain-containing protein [Streptomyces armeniacus]
MSGVKAERTDRGPSWRKSSYSAGNGGECVEIATCPGTVHVRDSKNASGPILSVPDTPWTAFLRFAARR